MTLRTLLFALFLIGAGFTCERSLAQSEAAADQLNRPPVAAPTSKIDVGAIPVVLSASQEADNFAAGLLQGLMAHGRPEGAAIVVVKDDHVVVQRNAGTIAPDTRFAAGRLVEIFDTIAAMQLIERGKLKPDQDAGSALGESSPPGITIEQILTRRAGDMPLLARMIEKLSGMRIDDYFAANIARPLGMAATGTRDGSLETTPADMTRLAIALINGGAYQEGRILQPASVEQMERSHVSVHSALPGWAYGFAEMRRNGWRALQQDARAPDIGSRIIVVPEARLAYFLVARGAADAQFWRALDNGLFDQLLPPRMPEQATTDSTPAPDVAAARAVAGTYEPTDAGLKAGDRRLAVRAGDNGALILSGAEEATLVPRPGGYWSTADGNVTAVARDGRLLVSTGAYAPLALYKRPELYAGLALLFAFGAPAAFYYERRRKIARAVAGNLVLGAAGASIGFVLLSLLVWLLAPTA